MIVYVHTTGDYGMNVTNFGIIRSYLYFNVNGTVRISHVNKLTALYLEEQCLELFSYLQAVVFVSNLCSSSIFFSTYVMHLAIFGQHPLFSHSFYNVCICLVLLFCFIVVFAWCSDNHAS